MTDDRLQRLTERQKQCLRLHYANYSAKQIGRKLDLSPHTVNEHFREARRILGVDRTMEAARMLVAVEGDKRIVPERLGVDPHARTVDSGTAVLSRPARNRYNLIILKRVGLPFALAFTAVALAGALIGGADALNRAFLGYGIDISDPPYRD